MCLLGLSALLCSIEQQPSQNSHGPDMPVGNVDFLATEWPAADSEVAHSPAKCHEAIECELVIKYTEVSIDVSKPL